MVDSVASTANVSRIFNDVKRLHAAGVPEAEIDQFLTEEGVTFDQIMKFNPSQAEDIGWSGVSGLKSGTEIAMGSVGELERAPGRLASTVAEYFGADPETVKSINEFRTPNPMLNPLGTVGAVADYIPGVSDWMKRRTGKTATEYTQAATTDEVKKASDQTALSNLNWEPQTKPGEYTKMAVEGATAGALTGGRSILPNAAAGALSGIGGQAAADVAGESPMSRIAGSLIGGAFLPGAWNAVVRPMGPRHPDLARGGDIMRQEQVPLTAGQRTGSKSLQRMEHQLGGDTTTDFLTGQKEHFSRAASRNAGMSPAMLLTAENLANNRARIGSTMDDLASRTQVPMDAATENALYQAAITQMEVGAVPTTMQTVQGVMDHVIGLARQNGGVLSGDDYKNITTRIRELKDAGIDPAAMKALDSMQEALEDSIGRSATPDVAQGWTQARNQYRNQLILEDAVVRGEAGDAFSGVISPARLGRSTDTVEGVQRVATGSNSPMSELAHAGAKMMPHVADSGTAANSKFGSIYKLPFAYLDQKAGNALMSPPVQGWLGANGPGIPSRKALATMLAMRQYGNKESDIYDRR